MKKFDVILENEGGIHLIVGVVEKTDHSYRQKGNAQENNKYQRQRRHLQVRRRILRNFHCLLYAPLDIEGAGGAAAGPPAGE